MVKYYDLINCIFTIIFYYYKMISKKGHSAAENFWAHIYFLYTTT